MRQKELRIALICYGGVSLAVYMHGVTKEIWHLARASRAFHAREISGIAGEKGSAAIYAEMLDTIAREQGLALRVLPDILTGASAGGINAVFLAQAVNSGQSLDPLTDLWLETADVDRLLDPAADVWTRTVKFWAPPVVQLLLSRPGNVVSESVAPEMRQEVRGKLAQFVRSRWFEPPFSGYGFSALLADALQAMAAGPPGEPLLPPGHPVDLSVTATDFHGYRQRLQLNSPPVVEESEHRLTIGFRSRVPQQAGHALAPLPELLLAARSTASFPGAFPPLRLGEIDRLAADRGFAWPGREAFLARVMPARQSAAECEAVSLIDGSVLVNAPFSEAMSALQDRPAQREVDRRFVYIDPTPDAATRALAPQGDVGFFRAIFGSISSIPREQPIRDNLEAIGAQSREAARLQRMVETLRPDVERTVEKLFGGTFFLDRPTSARLSAWRAKAQQAAAEQAGYAFHSYAQAKFAGIVDRLAKLIEAHVPGLHAEGGSLADLLTSYLDAAGLGALGGSKGGASEEAIAFFRAHDIGYRIRRLRLIARRLTREWDDDPEVTDADRDAAREVIYCMLALYFAREGSDALGPQFSHVAERVLIDPGPVLAEIARLRQLEALDEQAEAMLAAGLEAMPRPLRRKVLMAYLGFAFYDVATLPLLRNEGLTEFDPVKVDRISPEDAASIRGGGCAATLRGIEFYNFGAFFSRAYRENDYLWGRLHGAERMVDLLLSATIAPLAPDAIRAIKRRLFMAILDEEQPRLRADPALIPGLRREVAARLG
ncbi:patatin-like protein [Alteraurantiacibacter buctensis]|uniref:Patatin-like protein n=1 Tax=Alteraurantiacibacter buctensis TaxID=1503981 RepID=A0A844YYC3_9SPHN|nr:patatin-like protein [Alteraurantiacibacter buctensis]MXO72182.1 patatin-like protein [Alteraurantiacibacter buctensis]